MEQLTALEFLEQNKDYLFPNNAYTYEEVEYALLAAPDLFELTMSSIPFRKPSTVQIISVILGSIGVDRFYLGHIGLGILKYFSFGGLGIWWIADIVSAKKLCRTYNCKKLMAALSDPSVVAQMQNVDNKIAGGVDAVKKFAPIAKAVFNGAKDIGSTFYTDN